jgi:hypothetical protein
MAGLGVCFVIAVASLVCFVVVALLVCFVVVAPLVVCFVVAAPSVCFVVAAPLVVCFVVAVLLVCFVAAPLFDFVVEGMEVALGMISFFYLPTKKNV